MIGRLAWAGLIATIALAGPLWAFATAVAAVNSDAIDRSRDGDWSIIDDTDNNNGERNVYALKMHFEEKEPDWIKLELRCTGGKPILLIDWVNVEFPDQVVLTIEPEDQSASEPNDGRYLFEKSIEPTERGLRASPATSVKIVSAIGRQKQVMIIAHLTLGSVARHLELEGTQQAWSRVSRHCPVRLMPLPPI